MVFKRGMIDDAFGEDCLSRLQRLGQVRSAQATLNRSAGFDAQFLEGKTLGLGLILEITKRSIDTHTTADTHAGIIVDKKSFE